MKSCAKRPPDNKVIRLPMQGEMPPKTMHCNVIHTALHSSSWQSYARGFRQLNMPFELKYRKALLTASRHNG